MFSTNALNMPAEDFNDDLLEWVDQKTVHARLIELVYFYEEKDYLELVPASGAKCRAKEREIRQQIDKPAKVTAR